MSVHPLEQKGNKTMEPIGLYRIITMKPVTWRRAAVPVGLCTGVDIPRHWHSQSCCLTSFWMQFCSALPSFQALGIEFSFGK